MAHIASLPHPRAVLLWQQQLVDMTYMASKSGGCLIPSASCHLLVLLLSLVWLPVRGLTPGSFAETWCFKARSELLWTHSLGRDRRRDGSP